MWQLLILLCTVVIGFVRVSKRPRIVRGECTQCRYSLRGLATDGVCPECGTPFACNGQAVPGADATLVTLERPWLLALSLVVFALSATWPIWGQSGVLDWIEASILIDRGYRPEVAWDAARRPDWRSTGEPGLAACLASLLPLAGRMPARWGMRVVVGAATLMLAAGAATWIDEWAIS